MQREYELVYIFDSTLEEPQVKEHLERFHDLLKTPDSPTPITTENHWGKRTLAYQIRGKDVGYYVVVHFTADPSLLGELERAIKLDEAVIRYLIVLNEGFSPSGVSVAHDSGPYAKRRQDDDDDDGDDE